jgi:hypothetical protein
MGHGWLCCEFRVKTKDQVTTFKTQKQVRKNYEEITEKEIRKQNKENPLRTSADVCLLFVVLCRQRTQ